MSEATGISCSSATAYRDVGQASTKGRTTVAIKVSSGHLDKNWDLGPNLQL